MGSVCGRASSTEDRLPTSSVELQLMAPLRKSAPPTHRAPDLVPQLEEALRASLDTDGVLNDLVERSLDSLAQPAAIDPWKKFPYKLWSSAAATKAFRALLACELPGTGVSYETAISAISAGAIPTGVQQHTCYLIGGQPRDILRGKISQDVDFNYSCEAREVALVSVSRGWPVKYFCIGAAPDEPPNYVAIGDTNTENYMEGFTVSFNTGLFCHQDFRQNTLLYDLTNDVFIDKTAFGVADIRANTLRVACAGYPDQTLEMWSESGQGFTGLKELRYLKFVLRGISSGKPLVTDDEELGFVVRHLRHYLRKDPSSFMNNPLGIAYALKGNLKSAEGVADLKAWVCEQGDENWWRDTWVPQVKAAGAEIYLDSKDVAGKAGRPSKAQLEVEAVLSQSRMNQTETERRLRGFVDL